MIERIGNKYGLGLVHGLMGVIYSHRGAFDLAREYFNTDFEICTKIDNKLGMAYVFRYLGELYFLKGKITLAKNNLRRSLEIFKETGNTYEMAHVNAWLGRVYIEKDMHEAQVYLDHARAGLKLIEEPYKSAQVMMFLAVFHTTRSEFAKAGQLFEESRGMLTLLNRPFELARLDYEYGNMMLAMGDHNGAQEHFHRALKTFEELKAKPYIEMLEGIMKK